MSRNKLYTERLEICITPKMLKQLRKLAEEDQKTINQALRQMIQYCINESNMAV